ncbi:MAG: DUF1572 family protein [Flammeovirgaceae bacterium]|jgi:uncharacterized damage-inducible protein DinB|nr:DUF1572 family protein [Flammeovirgaceae bacterium]|tara:strand:- start:4481 stop:4987 length:507 start_codon:yes stop_codon:yes gene_type:complete
MNSISQELIQRCHDYFEENRNKILICLSELKEEDIWKRPNESSNAIGNQMLHLCGNIRQYVISSLGRQQDLRQRALEFSTKEGHSKKEITTLFADTVQEAKMIILNLEEQELNRVRPVQTYVQSGVHVLIHVTEHFSYHTGQIVFWTKQLIDKDLGFYTGLDLNKRDQ